MGGSMALRLQGRVRELSGVDAGPGPAALAAGAGVRVRDLSSALSASVVVVLATPVKETLRLLEDFRADPPRVRLLLDLGSTKRQIVEAMESLPEECGGGSLRGQPVCLDAGLAHEGGGPVAGRAARKPAGCLGHADAARAARRAAGWRPPTAPPFLPRPDGCRR